MVNRSKAIGTKAETLIARHARDRGFPEAERLALAGSSDQGDVRLCRGVIVESKAGAAARGAGPAQIAKWAAQAEVERVNHGAEIGVLVVQTLNRAVPGPAGWSAYLPLWAVSRLVTPTSIPLRGRTDAHLDFVLRTLWRATFDDVLRLLQVAGYGEPLLAPAEPDQVEIERQADAYARETISPEFADMLLGRPASQ